MDADAAAARRDRAPGRRTDATPGAGARSRSASPRPGCRRCRARPGSRSTSTRSPATWPRPRELAGAGTPSMPVVKADAYGHGVVPVARALEAAGADGLCVADARRGARAPARPGSRPPIRVLYPVPPALGRGRGAGDRASPRAIRAAARACSRRPRRGRRRGVAAARRRARGRDRASVAAVSRPRRSRAAAARSPPRRRALAGALDPPPGEPRTPRSHRGQLAGSRRRSPALAAAGIRRSAPPCRRERRAAARRRRQRYDAVRPGLRSTACVPDELSTGRWPPTGGRAPPAGPVARRPAGPRRRPAGRPRHQLRPDVATAGPAGSRRCRSATATAGRGRSRTAPRRSSAAPRVPLVGNVAMDAVMADVTDVPGRRSRVDDEFVLIGRQGDDRITAADLARCAHHQLLGGRDRDVPPPAPGVRCAGRRGRNSHAHPRGGLVARIELWNGDICDLEVDAIVNAANLSLWMATGVGGEIKRAGGDSSSSPQSARPPSRSARRSSPRPAARRPRRDPCRLARSRPADQR